MREEQNEEKRELKVWQNKSSKHKISTVRSEHKHSSHSFNICFYLRVPIYFFLDLNNKPEKAPLTTNNWYHLLSNKPISASSRNM